jgi:hypothetical protein
LRQLGKQLRRPRGSLRSRARSGSQASQTYAIWGRNASILCERIYRRAARGILFLSPLIVARTIERTSMSSTDDGPQTRETRGCRGQLAERQEPGSVFLVGATSKEDHFREWVRLAQVHNGADAHRTEEEYERQVAKLIAEDYSIHYHVWDTAAMIEMLARLKSEFCLPFETKAMLLSGDEVVFVVEKT